MSWGVIFDMDGVLVDSSEAHFAAWAELGRRHDHPFTAELFAQTFGMHNAQIMPLWLGDALVPGRAPALADEKETLYRELARTTLHPLEGATALVRALKGAGARVAVGSSGPHANVSLILEILGVADCFDALSTGDDVTHGKPHPEVFQKAAQRLGLEPSQCVVVEDAPQGIEAARAAGMRVVAVTSSRPAEQLPADRVVDSLAQLQVDDFVTLLRSPAPR